MGKAEKGTPKDVANKMKAKGLQKLRWFCQMCMKQCRDENGFKCHTMSEGHQRQLLLFAENPDKYLDSFSEEFFVDFTKLLKRRFGTKRVQANNVYQEYIHDREHIHMNSTQWETLTEFVKWLGREGHATVDETEKGWFIALVDKDPETLLRQSQMEKKEKSEKNQEERFNEFINNQIKLGKLKETDDGSKNFTQLERIGEETIPIDMKLSGFKKEPLNPKSKNPLKLETNATTSISNTSKSYFKKKELKLKSIHDEIIEEDKNRARIKQDSIAVERDNALGSNCIKVIKSESPWLVENIVVKIVTKELGSKFYKQKGVVREVIDSYLAIVKLPDCGVKLKLDQSHLETVVPAVGREVLIVRGKFKGSRALLRSICIEKYSATLKLTTGENENEVITDIPYENFSKLNK